MAFFSASLDASRKKMAGGDSRQLDSSGERRRLSRVRHDDRGNAYVEWVDAPADLIKRPKLEIEDESAGLQLETPQTSCDPYSNRAGAARTRGSGNTTRTDLRKLSEWIKMMRELEERKRASGEDSGGEGSRGEE
ncbi:MAG TPA: hypothetical protein VMA54_08860 [Steroidobacteraceae bacterium]|nr:hypothetical protein [Steroidobacteraceae bacterium]